MIVDAEDLRQKRCAPCEGGVAPLEADASGRLLAALDDAWRLVDDGRAIERDVRFAGWQRVIGFANAVSWIATSEGHHPLLSLRYGGCTVRWTTHAINGLSINDFICAAKVDALLDDE